MVKKENQKEKVKGQRAKRLLIFAFFLLPFAFPLFSSAQSVPARFANLNNVRYADGFAGADACAKIAAAIADAGTAGTIYVTASGDCGSTVTIPSGSQFVIRGLGRDWTTLTWTGSAGGTMFDSSATSQFQMRDLKLDGASSAATAIKTSTDSTQRYYDKFEHLVLWGFTGTVLNLEHGNGTSDSELFDVLINYGTTGLKVGLQNVSCYFCDIQNQTAAGLDLGGNGKVEFFGGHFAGNGYDVRTAQAGVEFFGTWFENAKNGILAAAESGPYNLLAPLSFYSCLLHTLGSQISASSGAVRSGNVVTITTTAAHGFSTGRQVTVSGVTDSSFNGFFAIASTPMTTTFTYAQTGSNATSGGGSAAGPLIDTTNLTGTIVLLGNRVGGDSKASNVVLTSTMTDNFLRSNQGMTFTGSSDWAYTSEPRGLRVSVTGSGSGFLSLHDSTPSAPNTAKWMRVSGGCFEILNSAQSAVTLQSCDNGDFLALGTATFSGGTITGGTSGLTLQAGGTNQSIALTPGTTGAVKPRNVAANVNTVTFSATPTFDATLGNTQKITLTGNVTSSTLSNATVGQWLQFVICQDATGSRTFVWPSNVKGAMTIGSTLSTCSAQSFIFDGSNAYALGAGVTNQ